MQNDHVSVDEAVARLLSLDFVPAPFTVLELLEGCHFSPYRVQSVFGI